MKQDNTIQDDIDKKPKRIRSSMMIFKDTKERLRKLKEHPRESFDEMLNRLLPTMEQVSDE